MKIFTLYKKQFIPVSLDYAWDFFSNPHNLSKITPPEMGFKIKNDVGGKIFSGMIIEYTVKPMFNIECGWLTEIKHVQDKRMFVDEQRVGPYKMWYHQHIFKEVNGGVEIKDIIHYCVPGWIFASIINKHLITKQLEKIFMYRYQIIEKLFKVKI